MQTTEVLAALGQIKADIDSLMRNMGGEGNKNTAKWLAGIIGAAMNNDGMAIITPELLDLLKTSGVSLRKDKEAIIRQYHPTVDFKVAGWPRRLTDAQVAVGIGDLVAMLQPSIKEKRFTRADVREALGRLGVAL